MELIKQLMILAVVIVAIIAILQLLIPYIIRKTGIVLGEGWAVIVGAVRIFFWALIAIFVIIICFELIACLLQFTGGIPFLDHR